MQYPINLYAPTRGELVSGPDAAIFSAFKMVSIYFSFVQRLLVNFTVDTFFLLALLLIFQVFGRKRSHCRAEERPQVF